MVVVQLAKQRSLNGHFQNASSHFANEPFVQDSINADPVWLAAAIGMYYMIVSGPQVPCMPV
jgi:hypothetical protein